MGLISRVSSRTYREKKKKKMAKRAQVEAVIKTIIREIIDKCAAQGHSLSESLVAFMVKAVVIDPTNGLSVERPLTDNDIQELITNCVNLLTDKKSCSLETVKMQVFFDMNYTNRDEMLEEHSIVTHRRLAPMCREISAALQSVYPQTELANFVALQTVDKQTQLEELCQIVTGIRLFNKECNKGGTGIDDLPDILKQSIPQTTQNIDSALVGAQDMSYKLTSLILKKEDNTAAERQKFLSVLYNRRQFEMYVRALMNDIIMSARAADSTINDFTEKMKFLKNTVQSKTAVPTGQVYPLFIGIAKLWKLLQEEIVLVGITANTVTQLQSYLQVCDEQLPEFEINKIIETAQIEIETDVSRAESIEQKLFNDKPKCGVDLELIDSSNCPNINQIKFDLSGFCPISLIKNKGLVLPGLPHLGIIRYGENFYVCSDNSAIEQFLGSDKNEIYELLVQVNCLAAQSPELIGLIGLSHQFTDSGKYTGSNKTRPILKRESGVQTDTHFYESHIDPEYHWNEWELRRKAIRLANLTHKITHSTQTNLSHFRRENETQVYLPKENDSQTKRDNWTTIPTPTVYYAGLRGVRGVRNFRKIDITLEK